MCNNYSLTKISKMKSTILLITKSEEIRIASFKSFSDALTCGAALQAKLNTEDMQYAVDCNNKRTSLTDSDIIHQSDYFNRRVQQGLRSKFAPIEFSTHKI